MHVRYFYTHLMLSHQIFITFTPKVIKKWYFYFHGDKFIIFYINSSENVLISLQKW